MPEIAGKNIKKSTLLLAGGGTGLAAFLWYRHKSNSAASSAAPTDTSSTGYSPSTGYADAYPADGTVGDPSDPYSTDPDSGMTYGDEGGSGFGDTGFGGIGNPFGLGAGTGTTGQPGSFTSNAQWAQFAEQELSGVIDEATLSAALGKYLTGQPMSSAQESLADQAIAIAGYPPVSGPSGFPPSMHTAPPTGQGSAGKATVPHVIGQPQEAAFALISEAGLKPKGSPTIKGKTIYVTSQSPKAGTKVNKGSTVTVTSKARTK